MQKVKMIITKVFIAIATMTLSYLSIYVVYDHPHQIATWWLSEDNFFFIMLVKYAGIIWSAAFLRVGGDWILNNVNPFKKQNHEAQISIR